MKISKQQTIDLFKRYKEVSKTLGIKKDEELFEQLLENINTEENITNKPSKNTVKKPTPTKMFNDIVQANAEELGEYGLKKDIIENKDNMTKYWNSLSDAKKLKYTAFELNVMWYLISKFHIKYSSKTKADIVYNINSLVKNENMKGSFDNIIV